MDEQATKSSSWLSWKKNTLSGLRKHCRSTSNNLCPKSSTLLTNIDSWQRAIYAVNPSKATTADNKKLATPLNKGHESMAYLTYLIDHYDALPSTVAFLHSHRAGFFLAWHVDAPLHDNVAAMRALQLDFVQRNGYVNLRCNWNPGCKAGHRLNRHITDQVWAEIFDGTSTPPLNATASPASAEMAADAATQQKFRWLHLPVNNVQWAEV
jgi:hypothetical protein